LRIRLSPRPPNAITTIPNSAINQKGNPLGLGVVGAVEIGGVPSGTMAADTVVEVTLAGTVAVKVAGMGVSVAVGGTGVKVAV